MSVREPKCGPLLRPPITQTPPFVTVASAGLAKGAYLQAEISVSAAEMPFSENT